MSVCVEFSAQVPGASSFVPKAVFTLVPLRHPVSEYQVWTVPKKSTWSRTLLRSCKVLNFTPVSHFIKQKASNVKLVCGKGLELADLSFMCKVVRLIFLVKH